MNVAHPNARDLWLRHMAAWIPARRPIGHQQRSGVPAILSEPVSCAMMATLTGAVVMAELGRVDPDRESEPRH